MNTKQFIQQLKETGESTSALYVRGRKQADVLGARELRTRKHDHLAVCWDDLGNATVLTRRGYVLNLLGNELPR